MERLVALHAQCRQVVFQAFVGNEIVGARRVMHLQRVAGRPLIAAEAAAVAVDFEPGHALYLPAQAGKVTFGLVGIG